jgi:ABC-2 type transport system permease protein
VNEVLPVARAVSWRVLHKFFTDPAFLLPSMLFPLFFFTAFVGALSNISNVPGFDFPAGYTAFQFVFVLMQSAAFAGVFTGFGIARDFETGFMRRLMLGAPNRIGIVLGYAASSTVRWLTTASVVTVVALIAGMDVGGDGVDIFGMYTLALLLNLAGTLWATGVAMRLRTQQAAPVMQMPVFLILFFAPVYVPLDLLEGWIHAVASVNPITALLEAGRSLIAGEPELIVAAFAIVLGLIAGFSLWATRGLRRAEAAG